MDESGQGSITFRNDPLISSVGGGKLRIGEGKRRNLSFPLRGKFS